MLPDGRQLRQLRALYAISTLPSILQRLTVPSSSQPVATLTFAFLLIAVHLARHLPHDLLGAVRHWTALHHLALDPHAVVRRRELWRLVSSYTVHVDLAHLALNVSSLLTVGPPLERALGGQVFAGILLLLGCASAVLFCILTGIFVALGAQSSSRSAAGFSCVLFALMPLRPTSSQPFSLGGFRIPGRFRYWTELVRTQILLPDASLLGHLCGLLVGYGFVALRSALRSLPGYRLHDD